MADRVDAERLRDVTVLAALPEVTRAALARLARCSRYAAGQELFWADDEREDRVIVVLEGRIDILFRSMEGKEMPVLIVPAGQVLELREEGWAGVDVTAVAVRDPETLLCTFPLPALEEAIVGCPAAVKLYVAQFRRVIHELGGLASDRLHDPGTRVRHTLWRDTRLSRDRSVSYTHEALAARATTDRARATREISELRREGVIEVERRGHRIIVLDPDRLTTSDS